MDDRYFINGSASPHLGRVIWYIPAIVAFILAVINWVQGMDDIAWKCLAAQFCFVMLSRGWDD